MNAPAEAPTGLDTAFRDARAMQPGSNAKTEPDVGTLLLPPGPDPLWCPEGYVWSQACPQESKLEPRLPMDPICPFGRAPSGKDLGQVSCPMGALVGLA